MELTAEKLEAVKKYMSMDGVDDSDNMIKSLYAAAVLYLKDAGIEAPTSGDSSLYDLAVSSLTLHWFDNRGDTITGTIVSEIPLGLRPIINQLKLNALITT